MSLGTDSTATLPVRSCGYIKGMLALETEIHSNVCDIYVTIVEQIRKVKGKLAYIQRTTQLIRDIRFF